MEGSEGHCVHFGGASNMGTSARERDPCRGWKQKVRKISGSEDDSKDCLLFKVLSMLKFGGSELQD